jgi:hypothetical protein
LLVRVMVSGSRTMTRLHVVTKLRKESILVKRLL